MALAKHSFLTSEDHELAKEDRAKEIDNCYRRYSNN